MTNDELDARLAAELGDTFTKDYLWCGSTGRMRRATIRGEAVGGPYEKCHGSGRVPRIPSTLELIEVCRQRGVYVFIMPNSTMYSVYVIIDCGNCPYIGTCYQQELEKEVKLAALRGLEAVH